MTGSKPPTQRQLRVGEEIRHLLSRTLALRNSGDDLLDRSSITVTEVRVSPDLQHATVFVVPLGGLHLQEVLEALKQKAWFFRKELARQLKLRIVPRLSFQEDRSFEQAQRIDLLLKSEKVRKDVADEE